MSPEVTVVVPTRDRLELLRRAVASVRAQVEVDWELVVVDDASSDGTAEWLASVADDRVRHLRLPERMERSTARNRGLAEARAPAILFLDDDDRLRPGALRALSRSLERHPGVKVAVGAKVVFDERGQHRRVGHPRWAMVRPVWTDVLAGAFFVSGQVLLRTAALKAAGGWNPEFVGPEDQDLWLRVPGRDPAAVVPTVVLEQRSRPEERYADAPAGEAEIRRRFLAGLPEADRRRAQRLIRSRQELFLAARAFDHDDFRPATGHLANALATTPALAISPVLGPSILLSLGKALGGAVLPRAGGRHARAGVRRLRTRMGRNPQPHDGPATRP